MNGHMRYKAPLRDRAPSKKPVLSRRSFLKWAGLTTAGLVVAGCQAKETSLPVTEEPAPEAVECGIKHRISKVEPSPVPTPTPAGPLAYTVAIAQAATYERALVQQKVQELIEGLGGLGDVVRPGDKVAIKINLTGGNNFQPPAGVTAPESYITHPEVVLAIGQLIRDAGAGALSIVEGLFDADSYSRWGYEEVAKTLSARLIDLNIPDPSSEFAVMPVGEDYFIYKDFSFNPVLSERDVFVSISKMKCHYSAGVTHSMKNLIGLAPVSLYRTSPEHWWRSALHGDDYSPSRLPRVIVDLNRARPVHLALVDGIKAAEGGEVPRGSFAPVEPGVLVAGLGLGSNRLDEIAIVGASIEDVLLDFSPSTSQGRDRKHRQPFT